MLKEVVEVTANLGGKIKIRFNRRQNCSSCRHSFLCGKGEKEIALENNDALPLEAGDKIEVGIEERKTFLAYLILFFIPALIFLAFLVFFKNYHEILSFFLALGAVTAYYLLVKPLMAKKAKYFSLKILREIKAGDEEEG